MPKPMEVFLNNVRTFVKARKIPLRPLTLLVGENSSGKTTFLAMVSAVLDAARFPTAPGFNSAPYNLGAFDTIVTSQAKKPRQNGRHFTIGFSVGQPGDRDYREVRATYGNDRGAAALRRVRASIYYGALEATISGARLSGVLSIEDSKSVASREIRFARPWEEPFVSTSMGMEGILSGAIYTLVSSAGRIDKEIVDLGYRMLQSGLAPFRDCFSFAPIRSKPRRTYDELSEEYSPEGEHVPTLLSQLLQPAAKSAESRRVKGALLRFGKESGLFESIAVKRLGKKAGDPFQIQARIDGKSVNLADVGYGVSQAWPIIVQCAVGTSGRAMLLQQPEVHLHPRAQAALGSYFAELAGRKDRMFLVETHSDYLVDRVRQAVAAGRISPDKVLILFFHKRSLETTVSPIMLDRQGNIENAPANYRSFFLQEELNLLERTGD